MLAGVCGGLGRYFGVDPVWFRLAFIILAIGGGSGVLFYMIAWIAIPEEGTDTTRFSGSDLGIRGPLIAGVILVGVGLPFLADNLAPWFNQRVSSPPTSSYSSWGHEVSAHRAEGSARSSFQVSIQFAGR